MASDQDQKPGPGTQAPAVGSLVALRESRERAIAVLTDAFARDDLDMEEFERRLGVAHRTDSLVELERVTADLEVPTPVPSTALAPRKAAIVRTRDKQKLVAILGGVTRSGHWSPAAQVRITTLLGGADLDFREAVLPPGVTEVHVTAILGGVNLIVPPHLAVEMEGTAILGGFAHSERAASVPDPDRPILRVSGLAVLGGVNIETRLIGEDEKQAERRRKNVLRGREPQRALPPRSDK
jgi:hypothetical protein